MNCPPAVFSKYELYVLFFEERISESGVEISSA